MVVDSKLDPILANKVRELLSGISTQITESETGRRESFSKTWAPKKTLSSLLEPHRSTAQLSPLIRQGRAAINALANDEVSKVDIPF